MEIGLKRLPILTHFSISEYRCYHFNPYDLEQIKNKKTTPLKVCDDVGGKWTGGDDSLAPGCDGCKCCVRGEKIFWWTLM